jgi:hypothetical protein
MRGEVFASHFVQLLRVVGPARGAERDVSHENSGVLTTPTAQTAAGGCRAMTNQTLQTGGHSLRR